jgi:CRP-like cAMP-binding protein
LFKHFTKSMRTKLLKSMGVHEALIGQHLYLEGEMCDGFIVIVSGAATITKYCEKQVKILP